MFSPKNPFGIDQTNTITKNYSCGTECLLKFNFQQQSSSFVVCFDISSNPNNLNVPSLKITNSFLSNTNNTGTIAVNFQTNNYWFDSLFITKPGYLYVDYKLKGLYDTGVLNSVQDVSASSLVIVCKDKSPSQNYLIISQNIIARANVQTNSITNAFTNLIDQIDLNLKSNDATMFSQVLCPVGTGSGGSGSGGSVLPITKLNINDFISTTNNYFYYSNTHSNITYHYVIYNCTLPIIITNTTLTKILGFYDPNSSDVTNKDSFEYIPTLTGSDKVFISEKTASNNLSQGEDDLYIRCQPTNQEGDLLVSGESTVSDQTSGFSLDSLDTEGWFMNAVMGIVIMLIIIKGSEFIIKNGTGTLLGSI